MSWSLAAAGMASVLSLAFIGAPTSQLQEKTPVADINPSSGRAPAKLKLFVPPLAELEIEGHKTKSKGETRTFITPPLVPGKKYMYTLKLTWVKDNRAIVRMAVAHVRAGVETVLDLRPTSKDDVSSRIIFVPTPEKLVENMLEMAVVKKDDVVYDLGCGDGRIVIMAAKKYGARGVGIEIDPDRVQEALAEVKKAGVEDLVEIRQGDALKVEDLHKATVVTLYMLPEFQDKLRPILLKTLKPGSRVVSHDYELGEWEPLHRVEVRGPMRNHILYLWRVEPPKK
jgi:uncharacterized protein (TIGR03000 family)